MNYKRSCQYCGDALPKNSYTGNTKDSLCCPECRLAHSLSNSYSMVCLYCTSTFYTRYYKKNFCSDGCKKNFAKGSPTDQTLRKRVRQKAKSMLIKEHTHYLNEFAKALIWN